MRRALIAIVVGAGALIALVLVFAAPRNVATPNGVAQAQRAPQGAPRGVPVETSMARAAKTTADIRAVGSLQSDESVKIAPEVAGRVAEIAFKEGEEVKEGDVLVKLDDALVQAEIAETEARYVLAKANFDRANALARTGNVTERARDEATSAFESTRASLELARVRLDKHTIKAPFPGTVGIRNISVGAFVAVGAEIVNLEKIDALKVDFKVPEVFLAAVRVGQGLEVTVDALPNRTFAGTIYAIDPLVDVNGRALQVRARLPNPDRVLRPGLFARITIKGMREENVVVVPESAVLPRGGETFVFRVEDGKAVLTKVTVGIRREGMVEIVEGLGPDDEVVTAGQIKIRDGAPVQPLPRAEA
jgi:membrane fusion protein, multidrug efflux system